MGKLQLKDLSLKGKRVLMRVDFNVPIDHGVLGDDTRIRAALPSIEFVLHQGASLILMSHLGRPEGKPDPRFSLAPCAKKLSEMLHKEVIMAPGWDWNWIEKTAFSLKIGQILFLENLRFEPGEEKPALFPNFTQKLAKLGDIYVNDAFGTAHRAHASTVAIAKFFPNASAMGFLMQKEIEELSSLLTNPKRPFDAIIGGAKISSKIKMIQKLLSRIDLLFIGGAMAFTFFKAEGIPIGDSLCEDPSLVRDLPKASLRLPKDIVIAQSLVRDAPHQTILAQEGIPASWQGVDIGPQTVAQWSSELKKAKTIFWNGPVGVFEMPPFDRGTQKIAECLSQTDAKTIVGGGDSVAAIEKMGLQKKFSHLSTGGGASLEFLESGHLPGIDALSNR